MARIFPVVIKRSEETSSPPSAGEVDVAYEESVVYADVMALGDGQVLIEDGLGIADFSSVKATLAETVVTTDAPNVDLAATAADVVEVGDQPKITSRAAESVGLSDSTAMTTATRDSVKVRAVPVTELTATPVDSLAQSDAASFSIVWAQNAANFARTGTPDSDFLTDGWVDGANTNVNHGNEANLQVQADNALTLATDPKEAFVKVTLNDFVGVEASPSAEPPMQLSFRVQNTGLVVASTVNWDLRRQSSSPFTESTLNYSNRPQGGTSVTSGTFSVAPNSIVTHSISLTRPQLNACIQDGFVYIRFWISGSLDSNLIHIRGRETTVAATPPYGFIHLTR